MPVVGARLLGGASQQAASDAVVTDATPTVDWELQKTLTIAAPGPRKRLVLTLIEAKADFDGTRLLLGGSGSVIVGYSLQFGSASIGAVVQFGSQSHTGVSHTGCPPAASDRFEVAVLEQAAYDESVTVRFYLAKSETDYTVSSVCISEARISYYEVQRVARPGRG